MLCYLLIISLPTDYTTARMRAWRGLKAAGAAVLRDGVYVLPASESAHACFTEVAADVRDNGGSAYHLVSDRSAIPSFEMLFNRSAEFSELMTDIAGCAKQVTHESAASSMKHTRKLRKAFTQLVNIDFFPSQTQLQTAHALTALEAQVHQANSPSEPSNQPANPIALLRLADYQGRVWATRKRPWADRLACAWLIQRYIDAKAQLLWLKEPADCPKKALGFDFDGARFSHVGARVTFEVMLASFGLETPALLRLGALIHYLDVGGIEPTEAAGIERALQGMCSAIEDDDALLTSVSALFDGLYAAFEKEASE